MLIASNVTVLLFKVFRCLFGQSKFNKKELESISLQNLYALLRQTSPNALQTISV